MTGWKILTLLLSAFLAVPLLGKGPGRAELPAVAAAPTLFESLARKSIAGEVMSVDLEKRSVVVRVLEDGERPRDVLFALDNRTALKKLRTPISDGDLSPGHLVKVTYRELAGRRVARRIEVTGKAVHPPMP